MNKGADANQAPGDNSDHDGNHEVNKAGRFMLKLSGEAFSGGGGSVSTPTSSTPSPARSPRSSVTVPRSPS